MFDNLFKFINNKNTDKNNEVITDSENDDENKSNKFTYLEKNTLNKISKYINNNNLYDVKTIKVIVLVGSDYKIGNISYTSTHLRKDGTLTNYPYEAWKLIQMNLKN